MVVVNETQGDEETSIADAGFEGEPQLTNRWFRAYRFTLAPGETASGHRHDAQTVIIQSSAGRGEGRGAVTFEFNEPGQWAYFEPGDVHELVNLGDTPLELVEVEVRRARTPAP
jgi:quercetin dioxygenase-like cupin family protein